MRGLFLGGYRVNQKDGRFLEILIAFSSRVEIDDALTDGLDCGLGVATLALPAKRASNICPGGTGRQLPHVLHRDR